MSDDVKGIIFQYLKLLNGNEYKQYEIQMKTMTGWVRTSFQLLLQLPGEFYDSKPKLIFNYYFQPCGHYENFFVGDRVKLARGKTGVVKVNVHNYHLSGKLQARLMWPHLCRHTVHWRSGIRQGRGYRVGIGHRDSRWS